MVSTTAVPMATKLGTMLSALARSCDKVKPLYLYYHSAYSHQTWVGGNSPEWTPTLKVKGPFDHVVLRIHVAN